MKATRFHFVYVLRFFKYAIVLAILPFLRLLLLGDWAGLFAAFLQDALIFAVVGGLAFAMWHITRCVWDEKGFALRTGLLYRHTMQFDAGQVAVVEINRPLHYRILGASLVTVYFNSRYPLRKRTIYLSKKSARHFAATLLPGGGKTDAAYKPTGWDRWLLVLLSANIFSTILIGFFTYRQISNILGERWLLLRDIAVSGILTLEQVFEALLPAGAAILAALATVVALATFLRSFVRTYNYETRRAGDVLLQKGGLIALSERRVRLGWVGQCDVRHTPFARLLRHRPVFIAAGGYKADTPLLLCKNEDDPLLRQFLPHYHPPGGARLSNTLGKSLPVFIWKPFSLFCLLLLMTLTAARVLPGILPLLAIPLLLTLGCVAAHVDAYFHEGAAANPGGGIRACYTKFYTRHSVVLMTPRLSLSVRENPIGMLQGRATLRIKTPARQNLRVRGVGHTTALEMRFTR